jgi:uncharacterized membrane protein YozB (DUF420 family)
MRIAALVQLALALVLVAALPWIVRRTRPSDRRPMLVAFALVLVGAILTAVSTLAGGSGWATGLGNVASIVGVFLVVRVTLRRP